MSGIFLNYRTIDQGMGAVRIDQRLCERFGDAAVFRDSRSIPLGKEFTSILRRHLRTAAIVLVVIGPHWLTTGNDGRRLIDRPDDFVRWEIATAFDLEIDVAPVLIGGATRLDADQLPDDVRALASQQYHHINPRSPEPDIDQLLDKLSARPDLTPIPQTAPATAPRPDDRPAGGARFGNVTAHGDFVMRDKNMHYHRPSDSA